MIEHKPLKIIINGTETKIADRNDDYGLEVDTAVFKFYEIIKEIKIFGFRFLVSKLSQIVVNDGTISSIVVDDGTLKEGKNGIKNA